MIGLENDRCHVAAVTRTLSNSKKNCTPIHGDEDSYRILMSAVLDAKNLSSSNRSQSQDYIIVVWFPSLSQAALICANSGSYNRAMQTVQSNAHRIAGSEY